MLWVLFCPFIFFLRFSVPVYDTCSIYFWDIFIFFSQGIELLNIWGRCFLFHAPSFSLYFLPGEEDGKAQKRPNRGTDIVLVGGLLSSPVLLRGKSYFKDGWPTSLAVLEMLIK